MGMRTVRAGPLTLLKHPAEGASTCRGVISSTLFHRTGCLRLGLAIISVCDVDLTPKLVSLALRLVDILENPGNRSP